MDGATVDATARARGASARRGTTLHARFDQVLHAARHGDEDAWAELYGDLAPVVLGYLRGHGAPDPEDLLGEVWVQVVRHIDGFEGDESGFRSWVFTIAHHRLVDVRRAMIRRPEDLTPAEDLDPVLPSADDAAPEALEALGTEEVHHLLDQLTEDQREVLLLRMVSGLRLAEVVEVTGRTRQAVKSLQRRGIEQLRRVLGPRSRSSGGVGAPDVGRRRPPPVDGGHPTPVDHPER